MLKHTPKQHRLKLCVFILPTAKMYDVEWHRIRNDLTWSLGGHKPLWMTFYSSDCKPTTKTSKQNILWGSLQNRAFMGWGLQRPFRSFQESFLPQSVCPISQPEEKKQKKVRLYQTNSSRPLPFFVSHHVSF